MFSSWLPAVLELLGMGAGTPLPVPPITVAGVGWVAGDDGLVYAHRGPHRKRAGEARRYWMDFVGVAEIRAGGVILTATAATRPAGLSVGAVTVSGTRVYATVYDGTAGVEYAVEFAAALADGPTVRRAAPLLVW